MSFHDQPDQSTRTAYHEAGHAVIAIMVGRTVNKVSIVPSGKKLGVCKMNKGRTKASHDALEADLLILLAGMAAEGRKAGKYNMQGASQDLREAEKLAFMRAGNANQAEKILRRAFDKVHNLMDQKATWIAIKAIAEALLENQAISGREADHHYRLALESSKKS